MISSLVLLAICAPLVHSSTPKPHLEVNNLQGLLPSSDPLENVRALLAEQIAGLSALLTQMTGVKCSSHSSESAQETLTHEVSEPFFTLPNVQIPLDGHLDEIRELKPVNTGSKKVARPGIPSKPLQLAPIPPKWYPLLYEDDCKCRCTPEPTPATSCCWMKCATSLVPPLGPYDQNTSVAIQDAQGSPVRVQAQTDLVLFASFISHGLVHNLGLESNINPWPANASDSDRPTIKIIGTIPITLTNFTKEELKVKDVFYVIDALKSTNEEAKVPELSIGVELLRQVGGLAVHPDVIV